MVEAAPGEARSVGKCHRPTVISAVATGARKMIELRRQRRLASERGRRRRMNESVDRGAQIARKKIHRRGFASPDLRPSVCRIKAARQQHKTTRLWPLYRSTRVSRHLQLSTGAFCWCRVLLPARALLTATSAFGSARRRWSSLKQCYLHCLRIKKIQFSLKIYTILHCNN